MAFDGWVEGGAGGEEGGDAGAERVVGAGAEGAAGELGAVEVVWQGAGLLCCWDVKAAEA